MFQMMGTSVLVQEVCPSHPRNEGFTQCAHGPNRCAYILDVEPNEPPPLFVLLG